MRRRLPLSLIPEKEEDFVFNNGSAHGSAKLIAL